jgi:hypothetical protein
VTDERDDPEREPEEPQIDRGDPDSEQELPPPTPASIGLPPPD